MVSDQASPLATLGGQDTDRQSVHVAELALGLAQLGHEVVVHTRRTDDRRPDEVSMGPGVKVHHIRAGPAAEVCERELPRYMAEFAQRLRAAWRIDPPDVIHAHAWMSGKAALRAAADHGVPVVQTFHTLGAIEGRVRPHADVADRIEVERTVARYCARAVAMSEEERHEILEMGAGAGRVSVVPCGVDTDHFTPHGPAAERGPNPRLLVLDHLEEHRGIDTVLCALGRLPDTELIIAGGTRGQEDPRWEAGRLRGVAAAVGAADRVRFAGRVPREDVPALIRSCDAVVSVPPTEACGTTAAEAMACGVPVVASEVGAHRDTVIDEVTGLLVPPGDPERLAERLRVLLADPMAREKLGAAAAEHAALVHAWPTVAEQTLACYRTLTGDTPQVPRARAGGPSGELSGTGDPRRRR